MSRTADLLRAAVLVFLIYSLTLHPAILNMVAAGLDPTSLLLATMSGAVLLIFCGLAAYAYFSRRDTAALLLVLGLALMLYAVCLVAPALLTALEKQEMHLVVS